MTENYPPEQLQETYHTAQSGQTMYESWLISQGQSRKSFRVLSQFFGPLVFNYAVEAPFWLSSTGIVIVGVRATKDSIEQPFHMSFAEIRFAAYNSNYRIARIFNMDTQVPRLRILTGISELSKHLLDKFRELPETVTIDSVCITPTQFTVEIDTEIHPLTEETALDEA